MHYFLSLEVSQKRGEIFLSQVKYIVKLLERCGMVESCVYFDETQLQEAMWKCCWSQIDKSFLIQTTCGGTNVLGILPTKHLLCSKYFESIYG